MAPDRGSPIPHAGQSLKYQAINAEDSDHEQHDLSESAIANNDENTTYAQEARRRSDARKFLAEQADQGQNFTLRGVLVGLAIGVIICFSNMYFGLQTGWVSGMAMPAALIGFAFFKSIVRYIDYPFAPVENVLVQTVAGAVGTMPLGCGFVGVLPALNYLLTPEENGPINLGTGKLIIWSLGICFFGVVFAVPLRKEVIIREKLKFPSGTATALMIGVLHGNTDDKGSVVHASGLETFRRRSQDRLRLSSVQGITQGLGNQPAPTTFPEAGESSEEGLGIDHRSDWKAKIQLLVIAFGISALYVCSFLAVAVIALIYIDSRIVLYPPITRSPHFWSTSSDQLAMDPQPITRVYRPRYHHGPSNNSAYASWSHCRLGHSLSVGKE